MIINDSKTPSGKVHIGSLRGPIIHDQIRREHPNSEFLFGVDDMDAMDAMDVKGHPGFGLPLCNVIQEGRPISEVYMDDMWNTFDMLGMVYTPYRMSEIYRSGRLNDAIHDILVNSDKINEVYRSFGQIKENWIPFNPICSNCGVITTRGHSYVNGLVNYSCGCGNVASVSPFNGNGKLPWKLEWAAKWRIFGITLEGAGKDHCTKGGSRDVADACYRAIWELEPPERFNYEFFLINGQKMSSSRGIGASLTSITDILPPELLKTLMLSRAYNQPVNFVTSMRGVVDLYSVYDKNSSNYRLLFTTILNMLQLPQPVDFYTEAASRKGSELTDEERTELTTRIACAQKVLASVALPEEKIVIQENVPSIELSPEQRSYLSLVITYLNTASCSSEVLQQGLYDLGKNAGFKPAEFFAAIYLTILGRNSGGRAGELIAGIDRQWLIERFTVFTK